MNPGSQMFNMAKWLIMMSGCWRLKVEGKLRIPYAIYQLYFWFIYVLCTVGISGNFFANIGVDNDKALEAMALAINNICTATKMLLSMKKNIIELLRVAMEDGSKLSDGDPEIEKILARYNKCVRTLNIIVVVYTYFLTILMGINGEILGYYKYQMTHQNATEKPEHCLVLWTPLDNQKYFDFILAFQTFLFIQGCATNYSCLALLNTLMTYAIIKLKILQYRLRTYDQFLTEIEEPNPVLREIKVLKRLKELIREHQELIRFVHDLNEGINYALLIEYSISSLMLASVLLQVVSGNQVEVFIPYGIVLAFQLFLLSWNADEIRSQSRNIANALYESKWYVHSLKVKRLIRIMLMRSKKELSLNIGPFGPNNVNAAMSRIKLAYSYVSVMSGNGL